MRKTILLSVLIAVLLSGVLTTSVPAESPGKGRFILRFERSKAFENFKKYHTPKKIFESFEGALTELSEEEAESLRAQGVRVFEDYEFNVLLDHSVPMIGADRVRDEGFDGSGTRVCIVDTGVDDSHYALKPLVAEYDFVSRDGDASDDHGHGTHVAGIVASQDPFYAGVSPGADLMAAKVLDSGGSGYASDVILGIEWCVAEGADIISMSIGGGLFAGTCDYDPVADAVNWARDQGVTVVVATGNDGYSGMTSPGCASGAITVGAVDSEGTVPLWSGKGSELDVVAPGVGILSTYPGNRWAYSSGTSMATPHVAGVAALLLGKNPTLTPEEVRTAITENADEVKRCERVICYLDGGCNLTAMSGKHCDPSIKGSGIVNAYDSCLYVESTVIDTDGDGIPDPADECPGIYGEFCNGCPEPGCSGCQAPACPAEGFPVCADDDSLCNAPNAAGDCESGSCSFACTEGFGNCDGEWGNGCEIPLFSDPGNCGSCGTACGEIECKEPDGCGVGDCEEDEYGTYPDTQQQGCIQGVCDGGCVPSCEYSLECDSDLDDDGTPDGQDACPGTFGQDCNGCLDPCSGCGVMHCNQGSMEPPYCMPDNSLCPPPECPGNGCGVPGCAEDEYGTFTPLPPACTLQGNEGVCGISGCELECSYSPACDPKGMHVESITISTIKGYNYYRGSYRTKAMAVVEILNSLGDPVMGAVVSGQWSGLAEDRDSARTNSEGKAYVYSNWETSAPGTFTFTLDGVSKRGCTYNPDQNLETEDSVTV